MLSKKDYHQVLAKVEEKMEEGWTLDQVLVQLKKENLFVLDVIKIVRDVEHIALSQAKTLVANHPLWKEAHEAHEAFHDELNKEISNQDIFAT
jgi:ribosomal protein L7/L12